MNAHPDSMRIFVGGLPEEVTKTGLQQHFGRFGSVTSVDIRTKRDGQGQSVNVFAYMDVAISETNFQKCISTYNGAKWKGNTMKVQVAKEDFLIKLAKERKEAQQTPEQLNKAASVKTRRMREQDAAKTRLEENMKKAGVDDFIMKKAIPGTPIPGETDWIVGKFGRVLPIMHMQRKDKKTKMTYDPSKYVHYVRKFKEDAKNDQVMSECPVADLTWCLPETASDMDRKRMGEFPDYECKKKIKSNPTGTKTSGLHLWGSKDEKQSGREKFPKLSDQDFEIVRMKYNGSAASQRSDLVRLRPYSTQIKASSKTNQTNEIKDQHGCASDVEDLLEQCKLESDEDSCGSADTDDICSFAKKTPKLVPGDREIQTDWAEEYYSKERMAVMSGDTEEVYGFRKDSSATGVKENSYIASALIEANIGTVKLDERRTSGAFSGSSKVENDKVKEQIALDTEGDDNDDYEACDEDEELGENEDDVEDDEEDDDEEDDDDDDESHAKKEEEEEEENKEVTQSGDRYRTVEDAMDNNEQQRDKSQIEYLEPRTSNVEEEAKSDDDSTSVCDDDDDDDSDVSNDVESDTDSDDSADAKNTSRTPEKVPLGCNDDDDDGNDIDDEEWSSTEDSVNDTDSSNTSDDDKTDNDETETSEKVLPNHTSDSSPASKVRNTAAFDSAGSQCRHELSDKIRLESVKQRQATILTQKAAVQQALKAVDLKRSQSPGTHVRFDSDDESSGLEDDAKSKTETSSKRLLGLFDSDDDDDEEEGMELGDDADRDRFKIKPQFQGKAGEKLLKLQDRIGMDSRFKLGEMFMEDKDGDSDDAGEEDQDMKAEKQKSLTVLEGIVGRQAMQSIKRKTISNFRDPSRMRYDPTREDHAQFELTDSSAANVSSSKKDRTTNNAVPPEVSKDTYYEVADLAFGQEKDESKPFSFFGEDESEKEKTEGDDKAFSSFQKDILASATLGRRQLTLDSSDCESEEEEVKHDGKDDTDRATMDTTPSNQATSAYKSFFFQPDDIRLKTGPELFCRKLSREGMNRWFEEQKAELQGEYKKRHQRALRDSKKASQQGTRKPRR